MTRGVASRALEAGLSFLIWREALSSEEPVGGASGLGVMDGGAERGGERRRWKLYDSGSLPPSPTHKGGARMGGKMGRG